MNFEDYVKSSYALNGVIPKTVEKREDGSFFLENEDSTYIVRQDTSFEQQLAIEHNLSSLTVFGRRIIDDTHWFDVYVTTSFRTIGTQLMVSPSGGTVEEGFIVVEPEVYPTDDFESDMDIFSEDESHIAEIVLKHLHQYVDEHPLFRLPILTGLLKKE